MFIIRLFQLPRTPAFLLCIGLFVALAIVDILTPPELDLSLFYVPIILIGTWNLGFGVGAGIALGAAAVQLVALSEHPLEIIYSFYWYLWLVNRWFTFFVVVALTYLLRIMFDRLDTEVRTDTLTTAANRRYFAEILRMQLARHAWSGETFAVAIMECDDFKEINDRQGRAARDAVLNTVVQTARRHDRGFDTIARLGADKFGLLMPGVSSTDALAIVQRLRAELAERSTARREPVQLSIGLAYFEATRLDVEGVITLCDSLMHRAKRDGKGQIVHEHAAKPQSAQST
jgi:diguanylate cyclase (GGDEF)-like protein